MEREAVFEVGVVGLAIVVAAGVAIVLGSGFAGGLLQRHRRREVPPESGSISPKRHHHVQAPAAH